MSTPHPAPEPVTQVPARYCRGCDYHLSSTSGGLCPECGRAFSPDDPRSYRRAPARSWRSRLRRWGMVLAPLVAVAVMWPKGWVYSEATWTDPNGGGKVVAQSLLIAHPWWTKGWYGPIGRTAQTGNALFAPPPGMRNVQMNVALWRCDSAALWKSRSVGRGSLGFGIPGPAVPAIAGEDEWTDTVRRYTRATADVTGIDSAPMGGLSLRARKVITAVTGVAPPLPARRVARQLSSDVPAAPPAQAAHAPIVPVSAKPLSTPPPNAAGSR